MSGYRSWLAQSLFLLLPLLILQCILSALVTPASADAPHVSEMNDRSHSLRRPFLDDHQHSKWWEFGGSTIVDLDRAVRLTVDQPHRSGWIFSTFPISAENFQTDIKFRIWSVEGNQHADGIAIWLTRQRATEGPVFGSVDNFEGVGIFLDTYRNLRRDVSFPHVGVMIGDGKTSYDPSDNEKTESAGCSWELRSETPQEMRISYWKEKGLELLFKKRNGEWQKCLEIKNYKLPSDCYLGFSARTGQLSDNHEILNVETRTIMHESYDRSSVPRQKVASKSSSTWSWLWLILKLAFVFGALVGLYMVSVSYRMRPKF